MPNPFLQKMGFEDDARLVIFHADDIGMCQATVGAYNDLLDFGLMSSAALMIPCGWFPAAAALAAARQADAGVHLTLTSELDVYRWGPISTRDTASGLLDAEGYFYRTTPDAQANGDPEAVWAEINAQIDRALAAGLDVTHIDTHMGTMLRPNPRFVPLYLRAAIERRVPLMFVRMTAQQIMAMGLDETLASAAQAAIDLLDEGGIPVLDHIYQLPLDVVAEDRVDQVTAALREIPPGITHFIFHPAQDTPELRALTGDWRARVADYKAFTSQRLRDFVRDEGIQVIGYRVLRAALRA